LQVVITTNSPGEAAAWVKPVAKALYEQQVNVDVVVTPCTFASGQETSFLLGLEGIRTVYPPEKYWTIASGLEKLPREEQGCVLFLGGDILHARTLGRLLNYPVAVYSTGRADKHLDLVFVADNQTKAKVEKRIAKEKIEVVGDLMLSSLVKRGLPKKANQIALFPGSRNYVKSILPFFLGVAEEMKKVESDLEFVVSLSPFVTKEAITMALTEPNPRLGGVKGTLLGDETIRTASGLEVKYYKNHQYEIMESSSLALTIPGTNTAEMGFYGLPMLVILPLNIAREVPLQGVIGLIGTIPYLGPLFKEKLIWQRASSIGFTALPNRTANREIVPEIIQFLSVATLAKIALAYFHDKARLQTMTNNLRKFYPENNAHQLIADILLRRWGSGKE